MSRTHERSTAVRRNAERCRQRLEACSGLLSRWSRRVFDAEIIIERPVRRRFRRTVSQDLGRAADFVWRPDRDGATTTIVERRRPRRYDRLVPKAWLRWTPVLIDDESVLCHAWELPEAPPPGWAVFLSGDGRRWLRPLSWGRTTGCDYAVAQGPSLRIPNATNLRPRQPQDRTAER